MLSPTMMTMAVARIVSDSRKNVSSILSILQEVLKAVRSLK